MTNAPDELPDTEGAYLLLIDVRQPLELPPRFVGQTLASGAYGYAGSAYGRGGIRARCRRHLEGSSTRRWHIDWLTRSADDVRAFAFPGGRECELIEALVGSAGARFPVAGFGSTDCRHCVAHLVQFDEPCSLDDIVDVL